jgi:hypothetical protein
LCHGCVGGEAMEGARRRWLGMKWRVQGIELMGRIERDDFLVIFLEEKGRSSLYMYIIK